MIGFISFVVVFSLLIFVHEFGHFVTAKLGGVRVEEFGFGYAPRLLKLGTWRGTTISLNMLPFGGFVRMAEDDPTVERSLANKGRAVRALVYSAGALMNLALAVVLYGLTFATGALTPIEGPGAGVYFVAPGSPAQMAGVRPGDTIVTIDGQNLQDVDEAIRLIRSRVGRLMEIVVRRNDELLTPVSLTPRVNSPPNEGAMGVSLGKPLARRSYPVWKAVPMGFQATYNGVRGLFYMLQSAVRKEVPFQLSGPIGIYRQTEEVAKTGWDQLLEFTAFLSINLFLINLLPLPALDGGRLIFILLEWLRGGRRVSPEKEGFVHMLGMVVLIAVMAVVTFVDYQRYFG